VVTFAIGWVLHKTMGFTISEEEEVSGIDLLEHAETAYDLGSFTGGSRSLPTSGVVAERTRQPVADEPSVKKGASA
jgi:Amt family ammonium transporter